MINDILENLIFNFILIFLSIFALITINGIFAGIVYETITSFLI